MQQTPSFDIHELIAAGAMQIHLQPIASMRRQDLIGVEALVRCQAGGAPIPPPALFEAAERAGVAPELDRLCRRLALESFRALHTRDPALVLFVNCHPSTFCDPLEAPDGWGELAARFGVDTRNVAVEVSEAEIGDLAAAREASVALREAGFLVALDDVGARSANLDRIASLQPDIIKADRELVRGVDADFHRREVLRSLVGLSERLGGWVIAEGVETQDEAVTVAELGGDIVQGYLLGRPYLPEPGEGVRWDEEGMADAARRFKEERVGAARAARGRRDQRSALVRSLAAGLEGGQELETALKDLIRPHASVLSAAVLDEAGTQLTGTVLNPMRVLRQKSVIFAPPGRGTDHSLKEYFYLLVEGGDETYESAPYVPLPTGDLAVTVSTRLADGHRVLCAHLRAEPGDLAT